MIAFNKIHKILDIDVIVPEDQPLSLAAGAPRKRPLNSIDAEGGVLRTGFLNGLRCYMRCHICSSF